MNDRYLYRAKRTDNGEWVEGYLYRLSENHPPFIMLSDRYGESHEVDTYTICQCTGLTDKNGKLIWENDIVKGVAYSADFVGRIIWIEKIAGFGVRYFNNHREPTAWENSSILKCAVAGKKDEFAAEVIGNIFDNPELLEVGE